MHVRGVTFRFETPLTKKEVDHRGLDYKAHTLAGWNTGVCADRKRPANLASRMKMEEFCVAFAAANAQRNEVPTVLQ